MMTTSQPGNTNGNTGLPAICNLQYLTQMMGEKKHLIKGIMDAFLQQIPEELGHMNDAVTKSDYAVIKSYAHTMKSSVSIMGITLLKPVLQEMEDLGASSESDDPGKAEKINVLNRKLNLICRQAIEEIEKEKQNYA